ncbi:unnamed protein product [Euphydryas editha]|uniref:Uncharacterized protein n=1 Tax=Euphydryas editha TaxID=104508 RepID=A0AAU9V1B8_EUPED|nr:unnamed protein product [Euphydryas editha]
MEYPCQISRENSVSAFRKYTLIFNDGSPIRRVYPNKNPKSALNSSLPSTSLSFLLFWKTLPSTFGNDYYPILLSLTQGSSPLIIPNPSLQKYKLGNSDLHSYAASVVNILDSLPDFEDNRNIFIYYNQFCNAIISSADKYFEEINIIKNPLIFPLPERQGLQFSNKG